MNSLPAEIPMTSDQETQLSVLRNELKAATRSSEEIRSYLDQSDKELRLYRSLFWGLLLLVTFATVLHLLEQ